MRPVGGEKGEVTLGNEEWSQIGSGRNESRPGELGYEAMVGVVNSFHLGL